MKYTESELLGCLTSRLAKYESAIEIASGERAYENGFDYPTATSENPVSEWIGAARELKNTIDMMLAK